jgi:hypothetical protein
MSFLSFKFGLSRLRGIDPEKPTTAALSFLSNVSSKTLGALKPTNLIVPLQLLGWL